MLNILIVDDDKNLRYSFKKIFKGTDYNILEGSNGIEAFNIIESEPIDLVFMDIKMPQMDGLTAMRKINTLSKSIPIILMTAYGTTDTAIETMKYGAFDYVVKPFDIAEITNIVEKVIKSKGLESNKIGYFVVNPEEETGERIIGSSKSMQEVYKLIGQVATADIPVLITGESGTGKELVAKALHLYSNRKDKKFVTVNCAAIPNELLESELFGYEKGAFTGAEARKIGKFEFANNGTIFLDEIGDMSPVLQSKILRIIQEGTFERLGSNQTQKVNVRIIAATNIVLKEAIENKQFREDLYYRLNTVNIKLPPLRERNNDIIELTNYFISKFNKEFQKSITKISEPTIKLLKDYNWPGNVRELENVIKHAVVISHSDILLSEYLNIPQSKDLIKQISSDTYLKNQGENEEKLKELICDLARSKEGKLLEYIESITIDTIMQMQNNNQTQSAKVLGINRMTLRNKLKELKLQEHENSNKLDA